MSAGKGKCGGSIPPMVQGSESWRSLEGEKMYHREVKKLCSNVGFGARVHCEKGRAEPELSVRVCVWDRAVSILGIWQHCLGAQL